MDSTEKSVHIKFTLDTERAWGKEVLYICNNKYKRETSTYQQSKYVAYAKKENSIIGTFYVTIRYHNSSSYAMQRKGIRIIINSQRTADTIRLFKNLQIPPFCEFLTFIVVNIYLRTQFITITAKPLPTQGHTINKESQRAI
jgi:hypothetical protein